jgi:hypothetical protein
MSPEEKDGLRARVEDITLATGEPTAAAIILLADRLVGVLDAILARLRGIEDKLNQHSNGDAGISPEQLANCNR